MSSILSTASTILCRRCTRTSACSSTNARSTSCRRRMSGAGVGAIASRRSERPSSTIRTSLLNRRTSWHPFMVETEKASLNGRSNMRRPWLICASRTLASNQCQSTRLLMIRSLRPTWKRQLLGLRPECEEAVPARRVILPCTPHATPTLP